MTGAPSRRLRAWQAEAIGKYQSEFHEDFLVTATPGAGKTTFALALASDLMSKRAVDRVIVVAPTDHLRTQWADAASAFGLVLDPKLPNSVGPLRKGTHGYVTTYAQVASHPLLHRRRTEARRAFVLLDEVHHAGDSLTWGEAVKEAFEPARRRLCLTGTPFRTKPDEVIPFVRYVETSPGEMTSEADYEYTYRDALRDGVVRPVVFAAYSGTSRWMNSAGDVLAATLGEDSTKSVEDAAWRTALDPGGEWVPHVIAAVAERVDHQRASGMPHAAGLILASDQEAARAYAQIAKRITGRQPVLILSDDPRASRKIKEFAAGSQHLAVCVRMVTEGVDVPRASVLGYLTSYRTPLFFAQAVGRVVRSGGPHESATVFLPAVRPILALAAALEEQRDHVVRLSGGGDDLDALVLANREESEPSGADFTPVGAEAEFAHLLHGGQAFMAPALEPEDEDFLGIPGLLSPEDTAALLASRDAELKKRARKATADAPPEPRDMPEWELAGALRREISALVAQVAARLGRPHSSIHVEVRKAVPGPPSASASVDVLTARRDHLLAQL